MAEAREDFGDFAVTEDRWTLVATFAPVPEQGWEEQNEGEDYASRVLAAVKKIWEYDDEVSNDYRGEGFEGDLRWLMSEDRTELRLFSDIIDAMMPAIDAVLMRTIPLAMTLTLNETSETSP